MEMLVQANSFPYMQGGFSGVTPEGKRVLSLDLLNRGVGPAHEQSLRVKVGEGYVRSVKELFAASLGPEQSVKAQEVLHPMWNRVRTRFIPGGQSQFVFLLAKTAENAQILGPAREGPGALGRGVLLLLGLSRVLGSPRHMAGAGACQTVPSGRLARVPALS